ncbi:adenylate/guanylate cyclase domain-containing protein [Neotabrizicola shimadae]|uniref:Adenylate/guanylate cyclase domain-containing protein n=1 Tax=Neotabrizicola shimadae TaxID=2807096 RepID=A0A8G1EC75_9RHOB|nr:adenylate/guanylate cyclase domain-containing protein [Neotabrizicola shimadae]QYZ70152.1 adenylate/guanylate cyclase domain-containing protein [Neotabrizicola shimadae]
MPIDPAPLRWGLTGLALAGALALLPQPRETLREAALDEALALTASAPAGEVLVVAIDSEAIARFGPWPWPRARMAQVVARLAEGGPAVLAVEPVLSGPDRAGPDHLARALAGLPGEAGASRLPDGNIPLSQALAEVPAILGASLSDLPSPSPVPAAVLLVSGPVGPVDPWRAAGLEAPFPVLADRATLGVVSLKGEQGGIVRRAPLLVMAGDTAVAGFALAAAQIRQGATALRLGDGALAAGEVRMPLGPTADFRIRPTDPATWPQRSLPLGAVLDDPALLQGKTVLVGLTAPEFALFRPTAATPVAPSVQVQADAVETLASGQPLLRPAWAGLAEAGLALTLAAAVLTAALTLPMAPALLATLAATFAASTLALSLFLLRGFALDPVAPALTVLVTGLAAIAGGIIQARRRAARLRERFERHLAPAVVARLAAAPGLVRLPGELREVTALFTDLEGFTAKTAALPPDRLIAILDRYFDGLSTLVHRHGGMIDKYVGDAAHVLFNAPLDLPGHPQKALDCARAISAFGTAFAADPQNAGLGRTRIGIETGPAVVGDVGQGQKLDYTAHGPAINLAARLEQACKDLDRPILAGPGLCAALPSEPWENLGQLPLKGFGPVAIHAPAP